MFQARALEWGAVPAKPSAAIESHPGGSAAVEAPSAGPPKPLSSHSSSPIVQLVGLLYELVAAVSGFISGGLQLGSIAVRYPLHILQVALAVCSMPSTRCCTRFWLSRCHVLPQAEHALNRYTHSCEHIVDH